MTFSEFFDALPAITAIVAIIAPVVSTALTLRSNERVKRLEISAPLMRSATTKLISTYSAIQRLSDGGEECALNSQMAAFRTACYELASLVPEPSLQKRIFAFSDSVHSNMLICPSDEKDEFQSILAAVSSYTTVSHRKKKSRG